MQMKKDGGGEIFSKESSEYVGWIIEIIFKIVYSDRYDYSE